jgi:hypothetical protein
MYDVGRYKIVKYIKYRNITYKQTLRTLIFCIVNCLRCVGILNRVYVTAMRVRCPLYVPRICLYFIFLYFMYLIILYTSQFYHDQYVVLAMNRKLPDDDMLTSKHVAASCMYFYIIM